MRVLVPKLTKFYSGPVLVHFPCVHLLFMMIQVTIQADWGDIYHSTQPFDVSSCIAYVGIVCLEHTVMSVRTLTCFQTVAEFFHHFPIMSI